MAKALVTGANRGIGLEFCKQLKEKGYEVTALCRESNKELESLGVEILTGIDVTDMASLNDLSTKMKGQKVDLLINNAGVLESDRWPEIDFDIVEKQFEINSMGPLKVTQALANCFEKGSSILMVTSRMGSIEDNSSGGYYGYRMSKAALNAGSKSLALDLKDKGIGVFIFHPGFVKTRMTGDQGDITPDQAASGILNTFSKLDLKETGGFWHSNGQKLPW